MRDFRVVTHRNWLAETFKPYGAVQDWGWDIDPDTAPETIWWAPGAWVASALKAGVRLPLLSAGPRWLDDVPIKFTGRQVHTMTVEESIDLAQTVAERQVFVKLPEAKAENFPARLHLFNRHWRTTIEQYGMPPDTLIQIQTPMKFTTEARFFVARQKVVASSFYKFVDAAGNPVMWGDPDFTTLSTVHRLMLPILRIYVKQLLREVSTPPGVVIDVGLDTNGAAYLIEANAAWSSGPYDCDPEGVIEAIEASHDFTGDISPWEWEPNPLFSSVGPLKVVHRNG